jgi:hypothetical protein
VSRRRSDGAALSPLRARLGDPEIVDGLYRALLGREPDEAGRRHQLASLQTDHAAVRDLVHGLRWSTESGLRWLRTDAGRRGEAVSSSTAGRRARGGEDPVYFLHIMKTAGTSLVNALCAQAGDRLCLTQMFLDYVAFVPGPVIEGAALVAGHLGYGVVPLLDPQTRVVTVIREPVSRVLSHYSHLRRDPAVVDQTSGLALEEFIRNPRWRPLMENFQARHLVHDVSPARAWIDFSPPDRLAALGPPFPAQDHLPLQFLLDYGPLTVAPDELEPLALERLESLDLVGVTEELDRFHAALLDHWGRPAPAGGLPRDNAGGAKVGAGEVPPDLMEEILAANQVDLALYRRARQLSERGWRTT